MLEEVFRPSFINVKLESSEKEELFAEMLETFIRNGVEIDRDKAMEALKSREEKMTTGIVPGVAIPHSVCPGVTKVVGAIGISKNGIEFGSLDGKPVHVVLMFLFGENCTGLHLRVMQKIAFILKDEDFVNKILALPSAEAVYNEICSLEESVE